MTATPRYVRYESATPNSHGRHPGIFAMLMGLRRSGQLAPEDEELVRGFVARSYALHTEPDASVFATTPPAVSWFVEGGSAERSQALARLATDVMDLLERYDIPTWEVRCTDPGRITYTDEVQIVAVPRTHDEHWPFG